MRKHMPKLATLIVGAGISGWLFASDHGHGGAGLAAVDHPAWRAECGSCHVAFHPGLLPERSWRRIMAGLDRHFGENAALDAATRQDIAAFLAANAADRSAARRSRKIAASIPAAATPLRVTETTWFERKHDELRPAIWQRQSIGSRANCSACHQGAERGDFNENAVRIPR